jgi:glycosyltransferase domain-containing protein
MNPEYAGMAGQQPAARVSLLIPTKNRPGFLVRLLRYYESLGFQGCIYIGDSSDAEYIDKTKRALDALQGKLDITYREYPRINNAACLRQLLDIVSTPYAVLLPDDDFIVPHGLEQCVLFLENHPGYSAAHGKGIVLALNSNTPHGKVVRVNDYEQRAIEGENAAQRLLDHLSHYSVTLFSVHRVESWREMYRDVPLLTNDTFGLELLPCCLSVILGKVKELDGLYLVRQTHSQRYFLPAILEWIALPDWLPSYRVFRSCLANKLSRQNNISLEKAHEIVEQAFWSYLTRALRNQVGQPTRSPDVSSRIQPSAGVIPRARLVWSVLRSLNPKKERKSLLPALLRPSSPYQADFMPVYRALTTPAFEFTEEKLSQKRTS